MARLFKGVRIGSFHHSFDLRVTGLIPRRPGAAFSCAAVMSHVALETTTSPYISLTRSYGVAFDYAMNASRARPTASNPAHVYKIDIPDPPPRGMLLCDPVVEVAGVVSNPLSSISYHHDGSQSFVLGVVDPIGMSAYLAGPAPSPPGSSPTPRPPTLSRELETMIRALRDAEVLVAGNLPSAHVIHRYNVF